MFGEPVELGLAPMFFFPALFCNTEIAYTITWMTRKDRSVIMPGQVEATAVEASLETGTYNPYSSSA